MVPIPPVLSDLLAAHPGVVAAWLFGSRAADTHAPDSDWDLLVLFERGGPADQALVLASDLSGPLGGEVDVIDADRTSIELAARALCDGILVHEADTAARIDAETRILGRAHDLAPLIRRQHKAILEDDSHERAVDRYREALGSIAGLRREAPRTG